MDIYKCPKMKIPNTFGKNKFIILYNKLKMILKEFKLYFINKI